MIRNASFRTDNDLVFFLHAEGISMGAILLAHVTPAGGVAIVYDDGTATPWVDGKPAWAGFSYGTATNIPTPAGVLVPVTSLRTQVTNENTGAGTRVYTATLAHGYVTPKSVTITDSGGTGETLTDDGLGVLKASDGTRRGTINYSTKVVTIEWFLNEVPTGNVQATYTYSTLPGSSKVPPRVELDSLLITCVSGAGVGNVTWKVYEDSAAAFPYVASGSTAIVAGQTVNVDLADALSISMDTASPNSRWVKLVPDNGTNVFQVQLRWKNPSWKAARG